MATKAKELEDIGFLDSEDSCPNLKDHCGDAPNQHEQILNELGFPGRYQVIQILLCNLVLLSLASPMLNIVFIGYTPPHICHVTNETTLLAKYNLLNDTTAWIQSSSCEIALMTNSSGQQETVATLDCIEGYDYSDEKSISMASEWDLVCDKGSLVPLVQTMFALGLAISAMLGSSLADRIGRKYVYLFGALAMFCTELGIAFAPNIYFVICLRFLVGMFSGGTQISAFVIMSEMVVSRYRQIIGVLHHVWWAICLCILAGLAHICRDCSWREFQILSTLFAIPACIGAYFTNDTPAWYYAKCQHEAAERILDIACKMNGKDRKSVLNIFRKGVQLKESFVSKSGDEKQLPRESRYTFFDIFRSRRMLTIFLVASLLWFTNSIGYYGFYLTSSTLAGDRILNFCIMAVLEIPGNVLNLLFVTLLGRCTIVLIYFSVTFLSSFVSTFISAFGSAESIALAYTILSLIGKLSVGLCFAIIFTCTPEFFPTTIRSVGSGSCAFFARVGGMIAPFMLPLYNKVQWGPSVLISSLCFLCLILLPFLPETKGLQLPNTIEEIVDWKRNDKRQISFGENRKSSEKC